MTDKENSYVSKQDLVFYDLDTSIEWKSMTEEERDKALAKAREHLRDTIHNGLGYSSDPWDVPADKILEDIQDAKRQMKQLWGSDPQFLNGQIIISPFLTEEELVRRTWRERLFTRPWQPLHRWRTVVVPMKRSIRMPDGTLAMHPAYYAEFSCAFDQANVQANVLKEQDDSQN